MLARRLLLGLAFLLLITLLADASLESSSERPRYKSPLGLAVDPAGRFAYVALQTADALAVVDLREGRVVCEIAVGARPYDVALHKGIAYVTCEADDTVVAVDVAARKVKRTFKVGQAPRGIAIDPVNMVINVVCHDEKVLWTMNTSGIVKKTPLPPQPEGNFARASNLELVLGEKNGYRQTARPFNLFTGGQSIFDMKKSLQPSSIPPLDNQRTAFNPTLDIDYSSTRMDLVAHTRPRWFTPTAHAQEGRVFTNALSFFLTSSNTAGVVLLDEPDKGYPDPTDVVVKLPTRNPLPPLPKASGAEIHPLQGAKVFVSSGGADTVVVVDLDKARMHAQSFPIQGGGMQFGISGGFQMNGAMPQFSGGWGGMMSGNFGGNFNGNFGGMPTAIPPGFPTPPASPPVKPGGAPPIGPLNFPGGGMAGGLQLGGMAGFGGWMGGSFGFREDLRASAVYTIARIPTQANPRRMALTPDNKTLIVSNHLADSLTLIDADKLRVIRHIDLGGTRPDQARRGEILFHSAKFTFHQQFTCASCHPNQGADGLTWNSSPDGRGEPLNTRALHGVRDTGPLGWMGDSDSFEKRAKNTMREVHKHGLSDAAASVIAAYMKTLDPPRPLPQNQKDLPRIARGKAIFHGKGNCKSCHRGPTFTSDYARAVILDQQQRLTPFDVPSLRGVARTAPYLHDGRAATLEEVFDKHNQQKRHGQAHELTRQELSDLLAFVRSL